MLPEAFNRLNLLIIKNMPDIERQKNEQNIKQPSFHLKENEWQSFFHALISGNYVLLFFSVLHFLLLVNMRKFEYTDDIIKTEILLPG